MQGADSARGKADITLTVAIPTLNEERHIGAVLESVIEQVDPATAEVFVLDGGSTDRTREIVEAFSARHPFVRLVPNPKRLQSAAVNLAASIAAPTSRTLLRVDAHALYPGHFVRTCVQALATSGAVSTVVPMHTVGQGCFQRAVAAAQNSPLGNGGSRHRVLGRSGYVDHGHHAAFDLAAFRAAGGYDETFSHNEDAELDHRLTTAGGRIFLCAEAVVTYFPRDRATALARQYFNHGRGRARTLLRHAIRPKPRQLLPPLALVGSVAGIGLAAVEPLFLALPLTYAALCNGIAAAAAIRERDRCLLAMGLAAMVMHFSWSLGFFRAVADHARARALGRASPGTDARPRRLPGRIASATMLEKINPMRDQAP
jgi:succinoglycan biosynthesis protein ExoA